MRTSSVLPADIRDEMARKQSSGRGGIGSGAAENHGAVPREQAPEPPPTQESEEVKEKPADVELKTCPRRGCRQKLQEAWAYCAACGFDLLRGGAAKRLGVTFGEEDLETYLFKGMIVRELKVLGRHKITVKTSQAKDLDEIDDYIMNGDWTRGDDGQDRKLSEFYVQQMNGLCVTAASVVKFDGESIGDTLPKRIEWLNERGAALVDMLSQRVSLFNQAVTEFLKNEDTILGS